MRALLALVLLTAPAAAGTLLENRQDIRERDKLERVENSSQRGAKSATETAGSYRAGRPFSGTGQNASGSGGISTPLAETPYKRTVSDGSISSGGRIRTKFVSDCPNGGGSCKNVTPYQPLMSRILSEIKLILIRLKSAAAQMKNKFTLPGLAALGLALYLSIFKLSEMVLSFAFKTDQKAQARVIAATARELQTMGEQMRKGKNLNAGEIEMRSKKAGAKARNEIKENLGPKE